MYKIYKAYVFTSLTIFLSAKFFAYLVPHKEIAPLAQALTNIGYGSKNSIQVTSESSKNICSNFPVSKSQTAINPLLDELAKKLNYLEYAIEVISEPL